MDSFFITCSFVPDLGRETEGERERERERGDQGIIDLGGKTEGESLVA